MKRVARTQLVVPAYSLAEPYETLTRRQKQRKRLKEELDAELGQIARTATYAERLDGFRDVTALLMNIGDEESKRLEEVCSRLTKAAEVIPLDASVLSASTQYQRTHRAARRARLFLRSFASRTGSRIAELLLEQELQGFRRPDGRRATRTLQLQAVAPIRFRQPFHSQRPALKDRVPPSCPKHERLRCRDVMGRRNFEVGCFTYTFLPKVWMPMGSLRRSIRSPCTTAGHAVRAGPGIHCNPSDSPSGHG